MMEPGEIRTPEQMFAVMLIANAWLLQNSITQTYRVPPPPWWLSFATLYFPRPNR